MIRIKDGIAFGISSGRNNCKKHDGYQLQQTGVMFFHNLQNNVKSKRYFKGILEIGKTGNAIYRSEREIQT